MKVKTASASSGKKTSARVVKSPPEKIATTAEFDAPPPPKPPGAKKSLLKGITDTAKNILKSKRAKSAAKSEPKTEVTAETLVRRTYTRRKKTEPPAILLEGDAPAAAAGQRARGKILARRDPAFAEFSEPRPNCPNPTAQKNFSSPRATRTGFMRTGI